MPSILIKEVPAKLRDNFKAACASEGVTMRQKIMDLMETAIPKKAASTTSRAKKTAKPATRAKSSRAKKTGK